MKKVRKLLIGMLRDGCSSIADGIAEQIVDFVEVQEHLDTLFI